MKPSIGRLVHYRLPDEFGLDEWRAAMVVQIFESDVVRCNLTVYFDALNDMNWAPKKVALRKLGVSWPEAAVGDLTIPSMVFQGAVGSAHEGTEPGDWRWPPRVEPSKPALEIGPGAAVVVGGSETSGGGPSEAPVDDEEAPAEEVVDEAPVENEAPDDEPL